MKINSTILIPLIAVVVIAIGFFVALRQPDQTPPAHQALNVHNEPNPEGKSLGSVDSLLTGLEARLQADPSDAKGWLLLAKSYSHLGRTNDALTAYAKAKALGQADLKFEALLEGAGGQSVASPTIRGRLTVADIAKSQLDPTDTIFIFAKSTDGSAMPVAVLRKTAGDLPLDFELSDLHAMSAAANLSGTSAVTVSARVSKSGNAMQAEPGLEVVSQPIEVGEDVLVELQLGNPASTDGV